MDRETIDEWLEKGQLAIVLAILAFAPAAFGAVRERDFVWVQWGIIGLACLWLVRLWVQSPFRFWLPPLAWAALPFVGYAWWRYTTSDIQFIARQEFLQVALCALLLFVLINNLHGQSALRAIVIGLITVATLDSIYCIYQWVTKSNLVLGVQTNYFGRGSGTYICPNHLAGLVEMCLPLALALVLSGRLRALPRVFLGYAAGVMVVGIAATGSRGGWICSAVSLLVLVAVLARRRGYRFTSLAVALIIVGGGFWLYSRTVETRVQNTYVRGHERDSRLWLWEAAYKMWKDNPWWGVGPGHFDHRYRAYRIADIKTQGRPDRVHNDYLNTLADYGLVGLALLLGAVAVAGISTIRSWPYLKRSSDDLKARESNRSALVLGAACGLVAILIHSFVDFNLHIPANAVVATTLLGIVGGHLRFATSRWWVTARWPVRLLGSAALIAIVVVLGRLTIPLTQQAFAARQAAKEPDGSPRQTAALRRAAQAEPMDPEAWFDLGEHLRAIAWLGQPGFEDVTREALEALQRSMKLNKWDPVACIRCGMCLDWLKKYDEALPYFRKALDLDPNYYYTRAMLGWHYFQAGDLDNAQHWNESSIHVSWLDNPHALFYRQVLARRLAERAEEEKRKK